MDLIREERRGCRKRQPSYSWYQSYIPLDHVLLFQSIGRQRESEREGRDSRSDLYQFGKTTEPHDIRLDNSE